MLAGIVFILISCGSEKSKSTNDKEEFADTENTAVVEKKEVKPIFFSSCDNMEVTVTAYDAREFSVILKENNSEIIAFIATECNKKTILLKETSRLYYEDFTFVKDDLNYFNFRVSYAARTEPYVKSAYITYASEKSGTADFDFKECSHNFNESVSFSYNTLETEALDAITTDNINNIVLTLKWKEVYYDSYGITFVFENEKGEKKRFYHIDVFGHSHENNQYYIPFQSEESIFTQYKINQDIKDKWYWVNIVTREVESDQEPGVFDNAEFINNIQPVQ